MLSKQRREQNAVNIGKLLRDRRVAAGYTQKALADALGIEYYTMISQMELGYISIPPALWDGLNDRLGLGPSELPVICLAEYQPEIFKALFGQASRSEVADRLRQFRHDR